MARQTIRERWRAERAQLRKLFPSQGAKRAEYERLARAKAQYVLALKTQQIDPLKKAEYRVMVRWLNRRLSILSLFEW